jgi:hypothetical protein
MFAMQREVASTCALVRRNGGAQAKLEVRLKAELLHPAQELTCTFVPLTLHTLQHVHRVRNERVREFLQGELAHL